MLTLRTAVVLSVSTLAILTQACTFASPTEVTMKPIEQDQDSTDAKGGTTATTNSAKTGATSATSACEAGAKFAKPDLAKLTACGKGKGHCAAKDMMPAAMQGIFVADTCAGGELCVDDEYIKAGGNKMTECKGAGGPGVCVNYELNAPMVANPLSSALTKDPDNTCQGGLVCIPCVDIRDGADTGMCAPMGLFESASTCGGGTAPAGGNAATTPTKAPAAAPAAECCGGKGMCMGKSAMTEKLSKDSCAEPNVCAPKALVANQATKCTTMLMPGICIGSCFNSTLEKVGDLGLLRQGDCAAEENCVPCAAVKKFMAGEGTPIPGCE